MLAQTIQVDSIHISIATGADVKHLDRIYDIIHAAYRAHHPRAWTTEAHLVVGERISCIFTILFTYC